VKSFYETVCVDEQSQSGKRRRTTTRARDPSAFV
jgi:hypothetical protein